MDIMFLLTNNYEYFPYETNSWPDNWLIRALLYGQHELVGKFSESYDGPYFEVQYALLRPNTALDRPRFNQSNCELVISHKIIIC